jgi:hypothetical protein
MRGLRSTLILSVVLVGLVAYIYFVESRKPAGGLEPAKEKAFATASADKITELSIKAGSGDRTVLKKADGSWKIVEPIQSGADETEVSSLASSLASLEVQRVVDDNAKDLKQYGLADPPRVDIGFAAGDDKAQRHLYLGDKTATGGDMYAMIAGQKKVFLVSAYLDSTFNKTPFDLRDKTVLKFDRNKADSVQIVTADRTIDMAKSGEDWTISKPVEARADYGSVEGLIGRLQTAQMKALVAQEATDLKQYGLDKPEVQATVGAGSSRATLELGKKSPDGTVYAKDTARPMVFTVETALADELKKGPDDYRRKDLFEFRPFNATKIDITRGSETLSFEKVKTESKDKDGKDTSTEKWREVKPAAKDVDVATFEGFLSKLSNLRAQSFAATTAKTGLDKPDAVVNVQFDDGKKQERVTFGKQDPDVFASRPGEPGAAKLDANEFNEAMKSLDGLK